MEIIGAAGVVSTTTNSKETLFLFIFISSLMFGLFAPFQCEISQTMTKNP